MATTPSNALNAFGKCGVVPVFYHDDANLCIKLLQASYDAGIRVFEFTNRGENARKNFATMLDYKLQHCPDMLLGIGTIKTATEAQQYIALGTDFIVSPIVDAATQATCASHDVLWVPGCMTPTELATAESLGATFVKLFPGNILGANFLRAIKPLFPGLKFMPTGGVEATQDNLKDWFSAGVTCVGMGSTLLTKNIIDQQDWEALKLKITQTFAYIDSVK
ncbi:2-dehydro-3-deoxyphosphogluconate aldolase/(4S)-4-hydroxy-2-oxoglutarate aldolase [Chitinophaga skermanii]|uniref:2-dehydro-3-deoxyphosphogluconate aldolase/(4S)-4-hydroxy-2-oxoglutarate aldolase n=1 Tax=Chitinophaga skermanii TaxID=331697 RepID=A0A327R2X5_9BACT|nr:bifunctional 4-hydroxy-2-oxoglutarate aldolase/2-dehydro-3-deoxy-phosphogluconate aldolase [Chitinophaga skermanii]RAJ11050.1 2-dehydro-3-deoxyphosphogluconate aldolase/(4S)-4-hydroxy-2-oxoglutarate aldolase [Chitinophaga skermanii]